jgi:hypothetical protein
MHGFERQLEKIKSKDDLHKWVDELDEGAIGLLLVRNPPSVHCSEDGCGEIHESYSYREIGDVTLEQTLYILKSYEHWMFGNMIQ